MKRNIFQLLLVALVTLALLVGCSSKEATPTAEEPVVADSQVPSTDAPPAVEPTEEQPQPEMLRAWVNWGDDPAQVQALFNQYTDLTGIPVEVNMPVPYDKIFAGLAGDNPPDILVLPEVFSLKSMREEGMILPLSDIIESHNIDLEDIMPAALVQCIYKEEYWCIPWGTDTHILLWNKDMFEDAGLDPEQPPRTLEELTEFADLLTKTDEDGYLTQVGFIPNFAWSHLNSYIAVYGTSWYSDDGTQVTINTEEMIAILEWERSIYEKYGAEELLRFTSGAGAFNSPDMGFYAGTIAMMIDGEFQVGPNYIQKFKPELFYGVAAVPYPEDYPDGEGATSVFGSVVVIPSAAPNPEASADLLEWILQPEIQVAQFSQNFNLPTSLIASQDSVFQDNKKFSVFLDLAFSPKAVTMFNGPITIDIFMELAQIEEQVIRGADPGPLLAEAEDRLQPLLDEALSK